MSTESALGDLELGLEGLGEEAFGFGPSLAWRDTGRNGQTLALVVSLAEMRARVVANGETRPVVVGNGTTEAVVLTVSENILIGGGGG